jgi:hypothetical protein
VNCDRIRKHLTGYLDGEVDSDLGSVIRGHLRSCSECRGLANDEATLRDGLRMMPSVDPPVALWAGVQARLAQEEVADSKRPTWRRVVARWMPVFTPSRLATGCLAMVATVSLVWWKTRPVADDVPTIAHVDPAGDHALGIGVQGAPPPVTAASPDDDVTTALAKDAALETASWQGEAEDLLDKSNAMREHWSAADRARFDAQVAKLRQVIAAAHDDRERQGGWREMAKYAQGAVTHEQFASREKLLAGGAR